MSDIVKTKPPVKVSPLIKAARWTFLLSGIYYGGKRKIFLERLEKRLRIIRMKQAEERLALKRKKESEELTATIKEMASKFSIELPKDFKVK